MEHQDHLSLIRPGISQPGGVWADLGSGHGAFTQALAELIGPGGRIVSVDRAAQALWAQERDMARLYPAVHVDYVVADFTQPLELPPLDGIIMANALHFVADKAPVVSRFRSYLKPGAPFILVEYNIETGNDWVPHPIAYSAWVELAREAGFAETRLLERLPSRTLTEIYSALSRWRRLTQF